MNIKDEVRNAIKNNQPVVALESTIISHGMPYPDNIEMALNVESVIRKEGAVPATIAILNGVIHVGLDRKEIEILAQSKEVIKTSKRDLAYVVSQKKHGATTVSATMLIAALAGINIFATGGIGGVHKGAETSFDISRDLEELSSINVAVICAGIKSILDLGLTLEYLETKGVEVIGYQTEELPAFYSRKSVFKVDYNMQTPKDIASLLKTKWQLGLTGGVVITNPIPERYSMDHTYISDAIESALNEAVEKGIKGKESTPYLLSKVKEITEGKSLESNIELVLSNAKLAAQIAIEYSKIISNKQN
ncbi:pseudouridine-5'-phosphate glycosidase [Liberiplasma polymorphum]|uniref:pseudouridine-5'-phosphate glycosidase n=1 Tax=Liberiplasma polymorphum TaxID=3374570 RepID=UPI003775367E